MKITRRQLRKIIQDAVMRQAVATPRLRRQNDRKGFTSGIYEEDEENSLEISKEEENDIIREALDQILMETITIDGIPACKKGNRNPDLAASYYKRHGIEPRYNVGRGRIKAWAKTLYDNIYSALGSETAIEETIKDLVCAYNWGNTDIYWEVEEEYKYFQAIHDKGAESLYDGIKGEYLLGMPNSLKGALRDLDVID